MSRRPRRNVSEIVEKYRRNYPRTERKALRKLILLQHKDINKRTLDRHLRKAFKQDTLEKAWGQKLQYLLDQPAGLWNRLQHSFGQVGGKLVEIVVQKAAYGGRDLETGWRRFEYKEQSCINGIMVPKNAPRLVGTARSSGICIDDEFDGLVLTVDALGWKDRVLWKGRLYEVASVEERLDRYSFEYRIGNLIELRGKAGEECALFSEKVANAQNQVRTFLAVHLNADNITKDNGSEKAVYCVIYADPNYSVLQEFSAFDDPVDGVYAVGVPRTEPLFSCDKTVYGYDESVPLFTYTIDKVGITSARLESKMGTELRRVCETHSIGTQYRGRLESWGRTKKQIGSAVLYIAEYVLNYRRGATS
jgi:hypothetical protein